MTTAESALQLNLSGTEQHRQPWIPWKWIKSRYSSGTEDEINTIFKAYHLIDSILGIERITNRIPPLKEDDACRRCGRCCAELVPEPVAQKTLLRWIDTGNPVHLFHTPVRVGPLAGRFHTGWYYEGKRLKMCPMLFRDPAIGTMFCALHHFGPGHRPPACERFKANWPHCEVSQRALVP